MAAKGPSVPAGGHRQPFTHLLPPGLRGTVSPVCRPEDRGLTHPHPHPCSQASRTASSREAGLRVSGALPQALGKLPKGETQRSSSSVGQVLGLPGLLSKHRASSRPACVVSFQETGSDWAGAGGTQRHHQAWQLPPAGTVATLTAVSHPAVSGFLDPRRA